MQYTLVLIGVVLAFFLGLYGLIYYVDNRQCNAIRINGIESRYQGVIEGCYVKVDGRFIPKDNWRGEYEK